MSTVIRLRGWWQSRDARERLMLTVMLVGLVAFAWWYGLLWPLRAMRGAAQAHYDRALAEMHDVRVSTQALRGLPPQVPITATERARRVLGAADAAKVPVTRHAIDAQGRVTVVVDAVSAAALFGWLDVLQRQHGIGPDTLAVARTADALAVQATFSGSTP